MTSLNISFAPNNLTIKYPIVFENGFNHSSNPINNIYNIPKTNIHGINVV